jgi:hypothetical protein
MRQIPSGPLALGLAGLIPFWGLALLLQAHRAVSVNMLLVDLALASYAAIILSFLGGLRWGLAVRDSAGFGAYALSVLPSLIGWACLAFPEPWRLAGLGLVLLAWGPLDWFLVRDGSAPPWLGRLRIILSSGAGVACLLGAAGWA